MDSAPSQTTPNTKRRKISSGMKEVEIENLLVRSANNRTIEISNPSIAVLKALTRIGDDDPAICLEWNVDTLSEALQWANAPANRPALPVWLPGIAYPITTDQVQHGISMYIAEGGSGSKHGNFLLAPNTVDEYAGINQRIVHLMLVDPFVAALCGASNGRPLARIYTIADNQSKTTGRHTAPQPLPAGLGVNAFD